MAEKIRHEGIVERVEPSHLQVRIVQASACAACGAKGLCKAAESKEKLVDVFDAEAGSYREGERVWLEGRVAMGMKAVRVAFLIPLVLMLTVFGVCYKLTGGNEPLSGIACLLSLVPYGVGLWLFRKRMEREFSFRIAKDTDVIGND
ncbi:MAG: SoxR reducing system RseC family protein [Bacteroidaceae bacterium]|nr:SoxR reducing system RseC family protein [Bacteroidaceae bacterium]